MILGLFMLALAAKAEEEGKIKLVGGGNDNEGGVMFYHCSGSSCAWKYVCDNEWLDSDASVVCRQLGKKSSLAQAISKADEFFGFSTDSGIIFDNVVCTGNEAQLELCDFDGYSEGNGCAPAGVVCTGIHSDLHWWTIVGITAVLFFCLTCILVALFVRQHRRADRLEDRGLKKVGDEELRPAPIVEDGGAREVTVELNATKKMLEKYSNAEPRKKSKKTKPRSHSSPHHTRSKEPEHHAHHHHKKEEHKRHSVPSSHRHPSTHTEVKDAHHHQLAPPPTSHKKILEKRAHSSSRHKTPKKETHQNHHHHH